MREGEFGEPSPGRLLPELTSDVLNASQDEIMRNDVALGYWVRDKAQEIKMDDESVRRRISQALRERVADYVRSFEAEHGLRLSPRDRDLHVDMAYQIGISATYYLLKKQGETESLRRGEPVEDVLPVIKNKTLTQVEKQFPGGLTDFLRHTRQILEETQENELLFASLSEAYESLLHGVLEKEEMPYDKKVVFQPFLQELFKEAMYLVYGLLRFQAESDRREA